MRLLRYSLPVIVFAVLSIGAVAAQDFDPTPPWPLCGRITENPPPGWVEADGCPPERWGNSDHTDAPFSSSFGPRPLASGANRYDFHRGIDIATPIGTPVFAIADGIVRTAGEHSSYSDPVIIVRHFRPGHGSCANVGCYHALYLHMSGWVVAEDDEVNKGQLLGYTGESGSGFDHLHFEMRDAPDFDIYSSWQRDAIHPMSVLPFQSNAEAQVTFDSVIDANTNNPEVSLTVTADRYDVVRVELTLYDATGAVVPQPGNTPDAKGYNVLPSFFDMEGWNFQYTHKDSSNFPWESYDDGGANACPYFADHGNSYSAHVHMDQQHPDDYHVGQFNGVTIETMKYWPGDYYLGLTFEALSGPAQCIEATVTVTDGTTFTDEWGDCTFDPTNNAPVADNDTYSTLEDTPLVVAAPGVLDGDTDGDGPNPLSVNTASITGPTNGNLMINADGGFTYTPDAGFSGPDSFTYTATDGIDDSNVATVALDVTSSNQPPTANAGSDQAVKSTGQGRNAGANVELDGGASTDDVAITSYSWTWDGGNANGVSPTVFLSKGTHVITLTVDDGQFQDSDTVCVEVYKNSPGGTCDGLDPAPTASFTYGATMLQVDFTDASTDSDGSIVAWSWDLGDGNGSTAQNPSHTYTSAGAYTVTLTVTDDDGNSDATAQTVNVSEDPVSNITLVANGFKVKGVQHAELTWNGMASASVDIFRDGVLVTTVAATANPYDDNIGQKGGGSYVYEVCQAGTSTCSNTAPVTF